MNESFIYQTDIDEFCDEDYLGASEIATSPSRGKIVKFPSIDVPKNNYVEGDLTSGEEVFGQDFFSSFSPFPSTPTQDSLLLCASKFRRTARSEPLEYGVFSRCDELVETWIIEYGDRFGTLLAHLYLEAIADAEVTLALLKAVSMLSWDTVYPHGQLLALAASAHANSELCDACIRAFENWEDKRGIAYLSNTIFREEWLENSKKEVLNNLTGI